MTFNDLPFTVYASAPNGFEVFFGYDDLDAAVVAAFSLQNSGYSPTRIEDLDGRTVLDRDQIVSRWDEGTR